MIANSPVPQSFAINSKNFLKVNQMAEKMTPQERIEMMKKNLGTRFVEEAKQTLANGKVLKGRDAKEHFNTELNELTFAIDVLYPLDYDNFAKEFPKTIELVSRVNGNNVVDGVNKGLVIQAWSLESNVNEIIKNINENVKDTEKAEEEIALRQAVLEETKEMKESFDIEWNQDLFWKCWKIKEGEARFEYLKEFKGEKLANKTIDTIEKVGGLDFLRELQKEVYSE